MAAPSEPASFERGEVIATGHNEVLKTNDPTRHAEICAVIRASKILEMPHFRGCEIYSTTEPCVMCFAAIHWAQIKRIYFGTTVRDVKQLGFNEVVISNRVLKRMGESPIELVSGVMREECRELLELGGISGESDLLTKPKESPINKFTVRLHSYSDMCLSAGYRRV